MASLPRPPAAHALWEKGVNSAGGSMRSLRILMPVGMALDILEHADMSVFSSASTWSSLLTGVASSAFWLLIIIAAFWLLIIIAAFWLLIIIAAWFCCMLMSSPRYLAHVLARRMIGALCRTILRPVRFIFERVLALPLAIKAEKCRLRGI